jgi:serine/threonine protein kinase
MIPIGGLAVGITDSTYVDSFRARPFEVMKPENQTFATGKLIGGRYRVLGQLGEGGMGVVYRAIDVTLNTKVVLKVPLLAIAKDPKFVHRFKQELRSLVTLSHPAIVRLLDIGEEEGIPYAVMPYLPGGDLNSARPKDANGNYLPVPPRILEGWLIPVAKALDFVHRKGIIHRDIKPANILFDGERNPFITDFGIAKLLSTVSNDAGSKNKTQTGVVLGTPDYTAPELIMGKAPSPQSDVFSLAITVYELVTGKVPYSDLTPAAVLVKQATEMPPSPSRFNPKLSSAICQAILAGLRKEPSERPASCLQFAQAVVEAARIGPSNRQSTIESQVGVSQVPADKTSPAVPTLRVSMPRLQLPHASRKPGSYRRRKSLNSIWLGLFSWILTGLLLSAIVYLTVFKLQLFDLIGKKSVPSPPSIAQSPTAVSKTSPGKPTESAALKSSSSNESTDSAQSYGNYERKLAGDITNRPPGESAELLVDRSVSNSSNSVVEQPFEGVLAKAERDTSERLGSADTGSNIPNPIDALTQLAKSGKLDKYTDGLKRLAKEPDYEARANFILAIGHALTRQSNIQSEDDEKAESYFKKSIEALLKHSESGDDVARNNLVACYNNLAIIDVRRGRLDSSLRNFTKALSSQSEHTRAVLANLVHLQLFVNAAELTKGKLFFKTPSVASIRSLENLLQENDITPSTKGALSQVGWRFLPFKLSDDKTDRVFEDVGLKLNDESCINCRGQGKLDCPGCSSGKVSRTEYEQRTIQTAVGTSVQNIPYTVMVPCPNCSGSGNVDCLACDDGREKSPR